MCVMKSYVHGVFFRGCVKHRTQSKFTCTPINCLYRLSCLYTCVTHASVGITHFDLPVFAQKKDSKRSNLHDIAAFSIHRILKNAGDAISADDAFITDGVHCDWADEETCYDGNWTAVSCAKIADGGCACPEGQEKCGANLEFGWPGWCSPICCDWETEEMCYDESGFSCAKYSDGGCPCAENEIKCGAFEGYPGYCTTVCCDSPTEETCYDEFYNPVSCAKIADGGCPCPEGQEKCGADVEFGWAGYCTELCCGADEEACYDENYSPVSCSKIADGGCPCPEGEEKCGADAEFGWPGWCTPVCCDWETEETCYDENGMSCAKYSDGGCPCAGNQTKCGAFEGYPGYCTDLCCDDATEETCYDDNYSPVSCAKIADGGCACPEGQEKCGVNVEFGWPGYCTVLCCDDTMEETCYDETYSPVSCAKIADGGCPCPEGQEKCGADVEFGWAGYCTELCCGADEEACYDENYSPVSCSKIADGGCPCPEGEEKCGADAEFGWPGWCTPVCCDWETEETCYGENGMTCAKVSEGGCS